MEDVKEIYIDSKGIEHKIDEMPNKMIYFTVLKYGTADLEAKGYSKIVDRFKSMMKEINIFELISEKETKQEEVF